jgi:uncharacterized membrane protein YdjX (TVP38/TMEM64 family)
MSPATPAGLPTRLAQTLFAPWARLGLLALLLAGAATSVLLYEPQKLLTHGLPAGLAGGAGVVLYAVAYGLCTMAFVPRPILNLAAGALFGASLGTVAAVAGTTAGAAISFGLGRLLGQDALRTLVRGRWLEAADGQLSRHGFRSMLMMRLLPGIPFSPSNYAASVSRMGWPGFLLGTTLGSVPNTAAYVVAGGTATSPTSPAFLISFAFVVLSAAFGAVMAWRKRAGLRRAAASLRAARSARKQRGAQQESHAEVRVPAGAGHRA